MDGLVAQSSAGELVASHSLFLRDPNPKQTLLRESCLTQSSPVCVLIREESGGRCYKEADDGVLVLSGETKATSERRRTRLRRARGGSGCGDCLGEAGLWEARKFWTAHVYLTEGRRQQP